MSRTLNDRLQSILALSQKTLETVAEAKVIANRIIWKG
jgi:hypothetical protein